MDEPEKIKRSRSPAVPSISLEKAVEKMRVFEAAYKVHPARIANAAKVWQTSESSSGFIQLLAALAGYDLADIEGTGVERKIQVSKTAITILKDSRFGAADAAKKRAALAPKVFAQLFAMWGTNRPPDDECLSALQLDMSFNEDTARKTLRIYDNNIEYALLWNGDKLGLETPIDEALTVPVEAEEPDTAPRIVQAVGSTRAIVAPQVNHKVTLMPNEKVLFLHEIDPTQGFRILATGTFNADMAAALKSFAEFMSGLHKVVPTVPADKSGAGGEGTK